MNSLIICNNIFFGKPMDSVRPLLMISLQRAVPSYFPANWTTLKEMTAPLPPAGWGSVLGPVNTLLALRNLPGAVLRTLPSLFAATYHRVSVMWMNELLFNNDMNKYFPEGENYCTRVFHKPIVHSLRICSCTLPGFNCPSDK